MLGDLPGRGAAPTRRAGRGALKPRPELALGEFVAVGAAAFDGRGREVAQAVLVVRLVLATGNGRMLRVLHVEVENSDNLEAVRTIDPPLEVAGYFSLRHEGGEFADRADEVVD